MELSLEMNKKYTYADYMTWIDGQTRELIHGFIKNMIVEILSPSTLKKDVTEKFALYEEFGVKEYWIVHPKDKAINVFLLQTDGKYDVGTTYEWEKQIPVHIFGNHPIAMDAIFN